MRYIARKWLLFQEFFSYKKHLLSCVKLGTSHFWQCNKEGRVCSFSSAWKGFNELTLTKRCLVQSWFSADVAFLSHVFLFPPSFLSLSLFLPSFFLIYVPRFLSSVLFLSFCSVYVLQIPAPFFRLSQPHSPCCLGDIQTSSYRMSEASQLTNPRPKQNRNNWQWFCVS